MRVATKDKHTRASPTIDDLITRFEMSNVVDNKSPKTIRWYNDCRPTAVNIVAIWHPAKR